MVAAVLWDFGGVITTSPFEAFNRYEAERGLPRDLIRTINATAPDHNAWALFERAEIDADAFDARFLEESTALGHPVRGADVLPLLSGDVRPAMVEALKACKARFKVGCITNNVRTGEGAGMAGTAAKADAVRQIMTLFDAVIESSKAGVRKPDPRIYLMMCEMLDIDPPDCVYLDDLGVNCKPAAALGMKAIKVTSEAQALADLAAATGLDFGLVEARRERARAHRRGRRLVGAERAARLVGDARARRHIEELPLRRLQRRVRLHEPRGHARRAARPSPRVV
jgi:putative hydrolase of the HAD superfamily